MKRITITVEEDVDLKFRKKASQKYHFEKGWYSKAVADAMKAWAGESNLISTDINDFMNFINPESWQNLKSEFHQMDDDIFNNAEEFMNYVSNQSNHNLKIDREGDNITVELKNNSVNDLKDNLNTFMILYLVLKITLFSLEKSTKDKYVVSGIGEIPPVYINKIK